MPSAGEILRSERTKRNRTLSDIANETCISKRYLEAIEVDRVQDLPGQFFYKAFLRQYAKALSLDEATTDRVLASAAPCDSQDPLPALNEVYENAQVGKSSRWNAPTGVAIGLLVAVLAGTSGLYALWQHIQAKREAAETAAASAPPPTAPAAATPEPAAPEPSAQALPEPAQSAPADPSVQQPVPVLESGKMSVDLEASEQTWVSLSSEGKTLFSGILDAAQSKQFAVADDARLTTGNAGGLDVRMNGKSIGPLGPRGQVRVVVFSANNAQILPPKPKVQPSTGPTQSP